MNPTRNASTVRKETGFFSTYQKLIFTGILCSSLFLISGKGPGEDEPTSKKKQKVFTVTTQEISTKPISPLLYGNFIELGYGVQVEPMWGEMFFNRSFEKFPRYHDINKHWFDLFYDEKDISKGYERDWSKFDWYHSGYEHNAWFAAPGNPGKASVIDDTSTFFIRTTPQRQIELLLEVGGSGNGKQFLKVVNRESTQWGAVAQEGKLLRKGETYRFRGMMKSEKGTMDAEVRLYPQGKWDKPIATFPLKNLGNAFAEQTFSFKNTGYDGYATFSLWTPPQTTVSIDDFSLMPVSNYYGWRKEVVETFKKLKPGAVRFPGGCFASFYDWRDGIGSYSERKPVDSYFWGGQNANDVGTAEFAMLCKASGAEMQMCVNVYHPSKRKFDIDFPDGQGPHGYNFPQFMSLTEGAKSAAEWVAYCNLPVGKHPMADLRAKHGYPEPFGVKFWELDNEVHRWFEAEDYALAAVTYAKAMKAIDPTIQIGLSSYGGRPGKPDYHELTDKMLEIAGPYVDFLADRGDADTLSARILGRVRTYNKANNTKIQYCDTEWLAYNTEEKRDSYNMAQSKNGVTKSYTFSKWLYGLNLLRNFMAFQRLGEDMLFVNFNNLANTHSQSAIETPKEGAYLTASGRAMELLANSPAAWVLKMDNYTPKMQDEYQVQAAWDQSRKKLVLYICNRTAEVQESTFDLSGLKKAFSKSGITQLNATGPVVMNTLSQPNAIKRTVKNAKASLTNGQYTVQAPAYSFTEIVLE
ncbi:MAG: hypothetical protein V4714_05515 [Bacteroidota bacterium]